MLVLTRKVGESIIIGGLIGVQVLRLDKGAVRLGITAPSRVPIVRGELRDLGDDRESVNPSVPLLNDPGYSI